MVNCTTTKSMVLEWRSTWPAMESTKANLETDKWSGPSRCKGTVKSTSDSSKMDYTTEEESSSTHKECLRDSSRQARRSMALPKNQYPFPKEKTTLMIEGIGKILPTGVRRRT